MQKKPRKQRSRRLRQCAAVFVSIAALWLIWLTADPIVLLGRLRELAGSSDLAITLLSAELGAPKEDEFSFLDRLVLSQSALLSATTPIKPLTPPDTVESTPPTKGDKAENPDKAPEEDPSPVTTTAPDDIIGRTMVAGTSSAYVSSGRVSIYNHTDYELDVDTLLSSAPGITAEGSGPQVLIFHSHATEAYTMDGTDVYKESVEYRTLDTNYNVVRIGAEITAILEAAGIEVIHDTTLYDYPSYNNAYNLSSAAVDKWLKEYPSIRLVIDVHRDALTASDGTLYKTVAGTVDNCAQVMMVMGSDATGQTHPNWRVNLALAVSIQKAMTDKWATLARPIVLRTSRFNQHQSTGEILLEVGTHGNTLQEAITAARLFARTIADMMT